MNPLSKLFGGQDQTYQTDQYSSIGATQSSDVTRYILQTDDVIEEIEMKLRGKVWSPMKERWVQKGPPLMNEIGINRVVIVLANFLNRHQALSTSD